MFLSVGSEHISRYRQGAVFKQEEPQGSNVQDQIQKMSWKNVPLTADRVFSLPKRSQNDDLKVASSRTHVDELQREHSNYRFSLPLTGDWLIGCREIWLLQRTFLLWTQTAPNTYTSK